MSEKAAGTCLNCDHPVDDAYCPRCGQKNVSHKVSIWHLLGEIASETFEIDGRAARTLVPFLFKPGVLTREYNAGRRVRYTSPFRLFLAFTLLWFAVAFVVTKTADRDDPEQGPAGIQITRPGEDSEVGSVERFLQDRADAFNAQPPDEQVEALIAAALDGLPKAALVLLPIFALVLKILFLRSGHYYVEHLVFALHVHAFVFLVLTLGFALGDDALVGLLALAIPVYVFFGIRTAYRTSWLGAMVRFALLAVLYGIPALAVSALVVILTALL